MAIYIRSSACISPQKTFGEVGFLADILEYTGTRLQAIEPDYKAFIDPKQARRMGHIIKMGIAAAQQCLNTAGITMPGAVIAGSALGCLEDTVTFLTRMVEFNEQLLPPTAFIQSTHNTVAAQIALMLKCHSYNNTYVHKGISFESALFDAVMLLQEQEADNVLVGGIDELVDTSFKVLSRLGLFKRQPVSNLALYTDPDRRGTIGGEGVAFFLLSDKYSPDNLALLTGVKTLYKPKSIKDGITAFLNTISVTVADIDLVINGKNGDSKNDAVYNELGDSLFKNIPFAYYKHLSGEYPTSSAFALWLAANIAKVSVVPDVVVDGDNTCKNPKRILIYNHYQNNYHSLMLVSAV